MSVFRGAQISASGTRFAVRARDAEQVWLCLFDESEETRIAMRRQDGLHVAEVAGAKAGQRYGYRAAGPWAPERGLVFDDAKVLVDPYATRLDLRFVYDPRLAVRGEDTAALVPKAILEAPLPPVAKTPPLFVPGGLIYEVNVRAFTVQHPDIPASLRGTIAALAHPAIVAHLKKLHVSAVELMPVTAWIDERHLPPLGLANAWGYNPVVPMALDPRLAPGGIVELRDTVAALREAGIGVILDLVFNHTGESDVFGPTLSLRGLENHCYARARDGTLINDTGTGNTLDFSQPALQEIVLDSLRHFTLSCGVDGFRFDLATVLGRSPNFDPRAPIFAAIADDPVLADRTLIAEPWDVGPGGYQLGNFPANWLEWNDRFRDDVRRFWRGDANTLGTFATRLCGSSDVFSGAKTRTVNYIASHDGFTLADVVSYETKHNIANGENNRDGQQENFSWNCGVEGATHEPAVLARRRADASALLATLFASRGTILLTAGDEFGRTQGGNNNAYAQDNAVTWLDWENRDTALEDFVSQLAAFRAQHPRVDDPEFLRDATWTDLGGDAMTVQKWNTNEDGFEITIGKAIRIRVDKKARRVTVSRPQ